jgi:hypothetical protein
VAVEPADLHGQRVQQQRRRRRVLLDGRHEERLQRRLGTRAAVVV